MDLNAQFEQAVKESTDLPKKPANDVLLQIYALYKQATKGDVSGDRPGGFDFKGAAKYDAWAKLKGKSTDEAKQEYVDLINSLK